MPAFAIGTPAAAVTIDAAVETLKVEWMSPPVPQMSIVPSGARHRHGAGPHRAHEAGQLVGVLAPDPHAHEDGRELCGRDLAVEDGGHERLGGGRVQRLAGRDRREAAADGVGHLICLLGPHTTLGGGIGAYGRPDRSVKERRRGASGNASRERHGRSSGPTSAALAQSCRGPSCYRLRMTAPTLAAPPSDDVERPTAEDVRVAFADVWGEMGPAWNVTPSVARVHGYLLAHGGVLTEREVREALGLSHRATSLALGELQEWGLVERADRSSSSHPSRPVRLGLAGRRRPVALVPARRRGAPSP